MGASRRPEAEALAWPDGRDEWLNTVIEYVRTCPPQTVVESGVTLTYALAVILKFLLKGKVCSPFPVRVFLARQVSGNRVLRIKAVQFNCFF